MKGCLPERAHRGESCLSVGPKLVLQNERLELLDGGDQLPRALGGRRAQRRGLGRAVGAGGERVRRREALPHADALRHGRGAGL